MTETRDPRPWRTSLVGAGWIAEKVHLPYLHRSAHTTLVGFYDSDPVVAERVAREWSVEAYVACDEAFDAEVVFVCTPPSLHGALVTRALEAGCHVVCEKPLALTPGDAAAIAAAVDRTGRMVFCCMTNRFRPDVAELRSIVSGGSMGDVRLVQASWLRRSGVPTSPGGLEAGVLWDLGAHLIDLVLWLTGWETPADTTTVGLRLRGEADARAGWHSRGGAMPRPEAPDTAVVQMGFGRERHATVQVSWAAHVPRDFVEITVFGTRAACRLSTVFGFSPDRRRQDAPAICVSDGTSNRWRVQRASQDVRPDEYDTQLDYFFADLQNLRGLDDHLRVTLATVYVACDADRALKSWAAP